MSLATTYPNIHEAIKAKGFPSIAKLMESTNTAAEMDKILGAKNAAAGWLRQASNPSGSMEKAAELYLQLKKHNALPTTPVEETKDESTSDLFIVVVSKEKRTTFQKLMRLGAFEYEAI